MDWEVLDVVHSLQSETTLHTTTHNNTKGSQSMIGNKLIASILKHSSVTLGIHVCTCLVLNLNTCNNIYRILSDTKPFMHHVAAIF